MSLAEKRYKLAKLRELHVMMLNEYNDELSEAFKKRMHEKLLNLEQEVNYLQNHPDNGAHSFTEAAGI